MRAVPYTFSYTGNGFTSQTVGRLIGRNPKYDKHGVIGTVRAYEVKSNGFGNPVRIYLWISANYKNTKTAPLLENQSGAVNGSVDRSHTACHDIVIALSINPNNTTHFSHTMGRNGPYQGVAVVFFEGPTNVAMRALNYVSEIFDSYIGDFLALHQSKRYLQDIIGLIDEIKIDYIAPYSGNRKAIFGYSTLRPRYTGEDSALISSFLENSVEIFAKIPHAVRQASIKAFGKKVELKEEEGRFVAMSFPQNIELSSLSMGSQAELLFERVLSVRNEVQGKQQRVIAEMGELSNYLDSLMIEYETSRTLA